MDNTITCIFSNAIERNNLVARINHWVNERYNLWKQENNNLDKSSFADFKISTWVECANRAFSEEEIRNYTLYEILNKSNGYNNSVASGPICYTYLCSNSFLSESFIKELVFLTSGFINSANDLVLYTPDNIELGAEIVANYNRRNKKSQSEFITSLIEKASTEELNSPMYRKLYISQHYGFNEDKKFTFTDRLDWKALPKNNYSSEFVDFFRNQFNEFVIED